MACSRYNCNPPGFLERLFQKSKPELQEQDLKKCLNLLDLTVQGLAHIIGVGIFIITPGLIRLIAGPGLILSYMISAIVLVFTVLCYMDLGARYKGIGNAYVYVYTSLGEFAAAMVGIFIMSEISLSMAMVAVGFGNNFDRFVIDNQLAGFSTEIGKYFLPGFMAQHLNLMAIALIVVCCVINCIGVKQVAWVNIATVFYSLAALAMFCVLALIYGKSDNLNKATDPDTGREGFFPYGLQGVITGAAITVVSYAGFESVVSLNAEAKNPKRDIPIALALSFGISCVVYVIVTASLSYMIPWYTISRSTGLAAALKTFDLTIPMYIIIAAVLLASASVSLCTLTTLARSLLVYSDDGLIFSILGHVMECSQVPVVATVLVTLVTILWTLLFTYDILIHLVSGGCLLTFAAVCFSLIIISYSKSATPVDETSSLVDNEHQGTSRNGNDHDAELDKVKYVEGQEWRIAGVMAGFTKVITAAIIIMYLPAHWAFWTVRLPIILGLVFAGILLLSYIKLSYEVQPQHNPGFECPGVPFIPALGLSLNMVMFSTLDVAAHLMSLVYLGIGVVIYVGYGYFNSSITAEKQKVLGLAEDEPGAE